MSTIKYINYLIIFKRKMKRSRNTIRSRNPTESMPETESAADSEYRKSRFKEIDESNNNHNIISNKVKAAKQMNSIEATDGIDPMSQQWQPKVVLDRLPEKSTIKMLCPAVEIAIPTKKLMKNSGKISIEKTVVNSFAEISPIKFDKDESFVTEYSPDTANDMFSKVLSMECNFKHQKRYDNKQNFNSFSA